MTMGGFVAETTTEFAFRDDVIVPALGYLRSKFSGLPDCEVLVEARARPGEKKQPT